MTLYDARPPRKTQAECFASVGKTALHDIIQTTGHTDADYNTCDFKASANQVTWRPARMENTTKDFVVKNTLLIRAISLQYVYGWYV